MRERGGGWGGGERERVSESMISIIRTSSSNIFHVVLINRSQNNFGSASAFQGCSKPPLPTVVFAKGDRQSKHPTSHDLASTQPPQRIIHLISGIDKLPFDRLCDLALQRLKLDLIALHALQ